MFWYFLLIYVFKFFVFVVLYENILINNGLILVFVLEFKLNIVEVKKMLLLFLNILIVFLISLFCVFVNVVGFFLIFFIYFVYVFVL